MNSVDHPAKTRTIGAPVGLEDKVKGLDVFDVEYHGTRAIMSLWQPTAEEIEAIVKGQPVALFVMGVNMPPVDLQVLNNG